MRLFIASLSNENIIPPDIIETYYVRPLGGDYGLEDGTSFNNAWDGEADINWSLLENKTLIAIGFADGSIVKLEPTTTINYIPSGIGVMIIGNTFQVT